MFDYPKTKEEARKRRYNTWAGNPNGVRYQESKCAADVWRNHLSYQCARKPGKGPDGLYCGIHAKMVTK